MHLENLSLLNFKNYEELNLTFSSDINVFLGKNGSGKTNLLDAVYFLALTKSAFSGSDQLCIRNGETFCMLKGIFKWPGTVLDISSSLQSGGKKVFRESQQEYERISDHIGKIPLVLISPDDTDLVKEGSELRRRFFDGIICQLDKGYLEALMRYSAALRNRNQLLKMFAESGRTDFLALESYDRILIETGYLIYKRRSGFILEFQPIFQGIYRQLTSNAESTRLIYVSPVHESEMSDGLKKSRQKDLILQRTSFGIHRDDYEFGLEAGEMKRFGSQGQQKSFVIALKLAQFQILKIKKERLPILLLDDIFDKLDDVRIDQLLSLMEDGFGQLFLTDARPHRTQELLARTVRPVNVFEVDNGTVKAK